MRSRFLLILALLLAGSPPAWACNVGAFDAANQLKLKYQGQWLQFSEGKASAFLEPQSEQARPEWELSVERSVLLHPEPGAAVRLVLIHASHLRGSGASDILLALQCVGGRKKTVLRLERPIKRLVLHTEQAFEVVSPVWAPEDALAAPSRESVERYAWSGSARAFRKVKHESGSLKNKNELTSQGS